MKRSLFLMYVFVLISFTSFSQENVPAKKECRISSGVGFSNSLNNSTKIGTDFWIQLSYDVIGNFSLATEFENMRYKHPGFGSDPLVTPVPTVEYNNNFSLLIKYNFQVNNKLKFTLASGWTTCIIQSEYTFSESTATTPSYRSSVTTFTDLRIPFLAELEYPVPKRLHAQARVKYSSNIQGGNTYSGGIGLSLQL